MRVTVEGVTNGRTRTAEWRGRQGAGGRFCSVFDFRGEQIARMYVYFDPDYTAEHDLGFGWSADQHTHW
jgi:hypothetical protein